MTKAIALNLSALNISTVDSEKRSVTSPAIVRPARDIVAAMHEQVRQAAWAATLNTVAGMYGKPVEAKGSNWEVNHDDAARAIRVNYNLIQPDYFPSKRSSKMDMQGSRDVWTQICAQLELPEPIFEDESDSE